jgi:hypothetical protein
VRDALRTGPQAPLAPFELCYRAGVRDRVPPTARLVAAFVCVIAGAGRATATEPELESLVVGPSMCPRPELVLAELATLLPPDRLSTRLRALTGAPAVELIDLGVPFQVIVGGRVREYRDEARDCTQRARVAAVFVAMTIDPASIAASPAPPPPVSIAAASAAPAPALPGARFDLAGAVDAGVIASDRVAQGGLELRVAGGRRPLAFVVGAIALWPVDTNVGGVRLHQWRLPVDAGVRFRFAEGRLAPYAELGVCAAVLSERALDLAAANSRTTIELGVRGALGFRVGASRFAPFAALRAELVPIPPEIYALPQGVAGHTPYLWIGASVGASLGFL